SAGGEWRLLQRSIGISAMHMQLLNDDRVVVFDRTDFGPSNLSLPNGRCRYDSHEMVSKKDCTAHSVLYDVSSNTFRALTVQTDPWCSSGAVLPNGTLLQIGGFNDGAQTVRMQSPCSGGDCDWVEFPRVLSRRRWYATAQILPDGDVIVVGGRREYSYEFWPRRSDSGSFEFDFLRETSDDSENNLYPFVHLLPDGNLFIFANTRSVLFDYRRNDVVREFPEIRGGDARNYPSSGASVLLPIDETAAESNSEIMICGGASPAAYQAALRGTFRRATSTCARLNLAAREPEWKLEHMPTPRVMSDMLILPTGDFLIVNGATSGAAGWENARDPSMRPLIYRPNEQPDGRFSVMAESQRPRLYHSTAVLLADGRILVGGSNPHEYYNFTGVDYPTDLSLESFSPPYLSPDNDHLRPRITDADRILSYHKPFTVDFTAESLNPSAVTVRLLAPPFSTHSFSMNQRMVVLKIAAISCDSSRMRCHVNAAAPSTAEIAPPGYYLLFVVHCEIPSHGSWIKI
ncbi:hypothetical protein M569_01859, partial [Genlisea aurea]